METGSIFGLDFRSDPGVGLTEPTNWIPIGWNREVPAPAKWDETLRPGPYSRKRTPCTCEKGRSHSGSQAPRARLSREATAGEHGRHMPRRAPHAANRAPPWSSCKLRPQGSKGGDLRHQSWRTPVWGRHPGLHLRQPKLKNGPSALETGEYGSVVGHDLANGRGMADVGLGRHPGVSHAARTPPGPPCTLPGPPHRWATPPRKGDR